MTKSNVDDVFAAAEKEAQSVQTAMPVAETQSTAVATAPSTALADEDLFDRPTGLGAVDHWVKVKYDGIKVDDSKFIESFDVEIDLSTVGRCEVVSYGDPAVYHKTYDGKTCLDGMSWAAALQKAAAVDPKKGRPYRAYDIPMTAISQIVDDKGNVLAEEGSVLGKSTTATETPNFQKFLQKCAKAGLSGETVNVRVGYIPRQKGSWQWGVLSFDLIED